MIEIVNVYRDTVVDARLAAQSVEHDTTLDIGEIFIETRTRMWVDLKENDGDENVLKFRRVVILKILAKLANISQ